MAGEPDHCPVLLTAAKPGEEKEVSSMTASGLMAIPEAAEYIGVSDKTIRRYISAGMLNPTNGGAGAKVARWMIQRKELDTFICRRTQAPQYGKLELVPKPKKRMAWRGESALTPDGHIPRRKPKPEAIRKAK